MHGLFYTILWIILTIFPVMTAWKRQWVAFAFYAAGWFLFLYTVIRKHDGWDTLADMATFVAVVVPIYASATIAWLIGHFRKKRKS